MSEFSGVKRIVNVLGSSTADTVTLTADYADNGALVNTSDCDRVSLLVAYAMGAAEGGNSIEIKVTNSPDRTLVYQTSNESTVGGTTTIYLQDRTFSAVAAAESYDYFEVGPFNVRSDHIKVSVKETGIAGVGGTCFVKAVMG